MSYGELGEEDIAAALQRLLAWPEIARSGNLSKFLSYIVERKLRGETQSIKAYSIAVDVFGRPADFDPQTDPIVRVQARRLRALISQFYREDGAKDEVRIALPTGRYVPEFIRRDDAVAEEEISSQPAHAESPVAHHNGAPGLPATWFLLSMLTLGLTVLALAFSAWGPRVENAPTRNPMIAPPSILVTEFQSLTGDMADAGMAAGLAIELMSDLAQFEMMSVIYGGGSGSLGTHASDYVLSGILQRQSGGLQYSAILTETSTGNVVWNQTIALSGVEAGRTDLINYVSDRLSMVLGSPRGPLHKRARALLETAPTIAGGENLYLCRIMFDLYREAGSAEAGRQALSCLTEMDEADAVQGQTLAAFASLTAEGIVPAEMADTSLEHRYARAMDLLAQAAEIAPVSAFVWEQRARLLEATGRHDQAEVAYSTASQINPANTDAIAAHARHLAFIGRQDAAVRLIDPVIAESPNPPSWYFCVPALEAIRQNNYGVAVRYAGIYAEADRELGPILAVMAGQGLGDTDVVNRYLPRVLDLASFRADGVLTRLRERISDDGLLDDIRMALLSAGVPEAALDNAY